jgi:hypothetical protein
MGNVSFTRQKLILARYDQLINTIKDELLATFVSLRIIVYPAILYVNLPGRFEISGEVHLQVCYKPNNT